MSILRRERVPDGPPIRRPTCDRSCETRWDREPRHSEKCQRLWIEANERVDDALRQGEREWAEFERYRRTVSR